MCLQESNSVTSVGATMLYEALAPQYPALIATCLAVGTPQKLVVGVIGSMSIGLLRVGPLSLLAAIPIQDQTVRLDSLEIFREQKKKV